MSGGATTGTDATDGEDTDGSAAADSKEEEASSTEAKDEEDEEDEDEDFLEDGHKLYPREVVAELDRYIVGQDDAKKAVAIALRNRFRRARVEDRQLRNEIIPKNILMIGPTGVGKTEVARRLAKLSQAPFIKVEATKFTEVGYHGRDVDMIIRDLVDSALQDTKKRFRRKIKKKIRHAVENRLIDMLTGDDSRESTRARFREMLRKGVMDGREIEVEVTDGQNKINLENSPMGGQGAMTIPMDAVMKMFSGGRTKRKKMTIKDARPFIEDQETEKLLNNDLMVKETIEKVETEGIVFIDEIDKICVSNTAKRTSADASDEGVQRDLLPLIEGCTVSTPLGNIDTSKILFVASGAFHSCKPSDLLAELQGRLPIRVELKGLTEDDLYRILTEPTYNMIRQQVELMKTEGIDLHFTEEAVRQVAKVASDVNLTIENIGARRLHTVIERVLEDISFNCDTEKGNRVEITPELVQKKVGDMLVKADLTKFIL